MEMQAKLAESDLARLSVRVPATVTPVGTDKQFKGQIWQISSVIDPQTRQGVARIALSYAPALRPGGFASARIIAGSNQRSEEHTSKLQSLMRTSYAVFCLKKKTQPHIQSPSMTTDHTQVCKQPVSQEST